MKILFLLLSLLIFRGLMLGQTITSTHNATLNDNALNSNWFDLEIPSSTSISPGILMPQSSGQIIHSFVSLSPKTILINFSAYYSRHSKDYYLDEALRINKSDHGGNFIESGYFLTSAGHQAFYIRFNDSTAKDIYEIWIDGKTEGYAGNPDNWLSVRMEIRSLNSLMTLEEAKSFANSITFKGGSPNPLKILVQGAEKDAEPLTTATLLEIFDYADVGYGWGDSSWFGYLWRDDTHNWIYHLPMRWLFTHVNQDGSLWLYSPDLLEDKSWLFTSKKIFPYLYSVPVNDDTYEGWLHVNLLTGKISIWESLIEKWNPWPIQGEEDSSENGSGGGGNDDLLHEKLESSELGARKKIHLVESAANLEMIWVAPSTFPMNPSSDTGSDPYDVTLTSGYYLGKFEVTHNQAKEVLPDYASFLNLGNRSVGNVSWNLANEFCEKLTVLERSAGKLPQGWKFSLPTEAEWENACRAGTTTNYWWGDFYNRSKQFPEISSPSREADANRYAPQIGLFPANPWGFYDMHGNVSEWCSDWNSKNYFTVPVTNPTGPTSGTQRIIRGASAYFLDLKASGRWHANTSDDDDSHGLRVALKLENPVAPKYEPEAFTPERENHFIPSAANMEMIWVSPGTFNMGSPESEKGRKDDEQMHEVTITKGFHLGKHEVTNAQYEAVMSDNNQGIEAGLDNAAGSDFPAEQIRWDHLQAFLEILNAKEKSAGRLQDGWAFALPSEAEWEYACRAGTNTAFYWGDLILADNANWGSGQPKRVGQYASNPWGFHDMHGNVAEVTSDLYSTYSLNSITDPTGGGDVGYNVTRGGSYKKYFTKGKWFNVRSAARLKVTTAWNWSKVPAFRLAMKKISSSSDQYNNEHSNSQSSNSLDSGENNNPENPENSSGETNQNEIDENSLNEGLALWYTFNGKLTGWSGDLVNDRHNRANSAFALNGNRDHIDVPLSSRVGKDFTLSMWIKLENNSKGILFSDYYLYNGFFLLMSSDGNLECRFTNGQKTSASINWNIKENTQGEWNQIALVNNDDKADFFVNGIKVQTETNTELSLNSSTRFKPAIGKASWFNGNYFNGTIDDFRIYDRPLSELQIKALHNSESSTQ
jgi:formylglycine-generating enzyme required for sulfatase activity